MPASQIYQATVVLTDAQMKALPTTVRELIPAPGNGKVICPVFALLVCDTTGGAYTNIDANAKFGFFLDLSEVTNFSSTNSKNLLNSGDSETLMIDSVLISTGVQYASFDIINLPLNLLITNGAAGVLTGGNAANTLTVVVNYLIIDVV